MKKNNILYAIGNMILPVSNGILALTVAKFLDLQIAAQLAVSTAVATTFLAPYSGSLPTLIRRNTTNNNASIILKSYTIIGAYFYIVALLLSSIYFSFSSKFDLVTMILLVLPKITEISIELFFAHLQTTSQIKLFLKLRAVQSLTILVGATASVIIKSIYPYIILTACFDICMLSIFVKKINVADKISMLKTDKVQLFNMCLASLFFVAQSRIGTLVSANIIDVRQFGIYSTVLTLVSGAALIANAFAINIFSEFNQTDARNGSLDNSLAEDFFKKTTKYFILALILVGLLVKVSPVGITWIGQDGKDPLKLQIVRIAIFCLIPMCILPTFGYYLILLNQIHWSLYLNALFLIVNFVVTVIGCNRFGALGMAYSSLLTVSLYTLFHYILVSVGLKCSVKEKIFT